MVKLEKVNPKPLIVITVDYDTALCLSVLLSRHTTEEAGTIGGSTDAPELTDLGKLQLALSDLMAGE